jgi:hypothetical protein
MSPLAAKILAMVERSEAQGDFGAWAATYMQVDGVLVCSSLSDRLEVRPDLVRAAIAELREAGKIAPEGVRLQPHARLGIACAEDLDAEGEDMRTAIVRMLERGPRTGAELLGPKAAGNRKKMLARMCRDGIVAPLGALWSVR